VISILKPGKDPALPSSYRPTSLLDTIGKLFEKILLARIFHEVNERGLMRDKQFGFRPRYSTSLQLARTVGRIARNFGEKRLTGAVFLDVAEAFVTVLIDGLLYKPHTPQLPALHNPYNLIQPQGQDVRSVLPDGHVISSRHAGWGGSGGIYLPVLFLPFVNDTPPPSHHVELALYADDNVIIATSQKLALLFSYLESYVNDLQR